VIFIGTKHLICVYVNGEYKVSQYGHWDGYPEGQGVDILNFLIKEFNRNIFIEKLNNMVSFGTEEELNNQWKECGYPGSGTIEREVFDEHKMKFPENSRDTGAGIFQIIQNTSKPLKLINNIHFAADPSCAWAYVIDLDKNTFEVYIGFNTEPLSVNDRFYSLSPYCAGYYPVRLLVSFDLSKLPTRRHFLSSITKKCKKLGLY